MGNARYSGKRARGSARLLIALLLAYALVLQGLLAGLASADALPVGWRTSDAPLGTLCTTLADGGLAASEDGGAPARPAPTGHCTLCALGAAIVLPTPLTLPLPLPRPREDGRPRDPAPPFLSPAITEQARPRAPPSVPA